MATEAHIREPISETCRAEKDTEMLTEASNVVLDKPVGIAEPLPNKDLEIMRKHFEVEVTKGAIEGNTGTIEGEYIYESPSVTKVAGEQIISLSELNEAAKVLHETESKFSESSVGKETEDNHVEIFSTIKENSAEEIQHISKETLSGWNNELNGRRAPEDNADLREANSSQSAEGEVYESDLAEKMRVEYVREACNTYDSAEKIPTIEPASAKEDLCETTLSEEGLRNTISESRHEEESEKPLISEDKNTDPGDIKSRAYIEDEDTNKETILCDASENVTSKSEDPSDQNEEATEICENANKKLGSPSTVTPVEETCLLKTGSDDIHSEAIKSSDHLANEHNAEAEASTDGNKHVSITTQSFSPNEQNEKEETQNSKNELLDIPLIADVRSNKDEKLEENTNPTFKKKSQDASEMSKNISDITSEECDIQSTNTSGYSGIESEDVSFQKVDKPLTSITLVPENVSCSQNATKETDTKPDSKVHLASTEALTGEYRDEERSTVTDEIYTEVEEHRKLNDDGTFLLSETTQINPEEPLYVAPDEINASASCQNTETATTIEKQRSNVNPPEVAKEGRKDETVDADYTQKKQTSDEKNVSTVDLNEEEDGDILCNIAKDPQSTLPLVEETKQEQVCEENQIPIKEPKHVHDAPEANSIPENSSFGQKLAEGASDMDLTSTSQMDAYKLEIGTKLNSTEKLQINAEDNTNDKLQQHGEASQEQDHESLKEIENTIHVSETTFDASSVTNSEEARLHKEESSTPELTFESLEGMQDGSRIKAKEKEYQTEETSEVQPQQSVHEIQFSDPQSVENDKSVETGAEKTFTDDHSLSSESSKKDDDDLAISHSTDREILPVKVGKEYNEASHVESEKSEKILESVTHEHYSEVPYEIESGMKEESLEAATTEIGVEKILNEETNEAKGTTEHYISSEKIREEDSHFDPTEKEIIREELPSITTHVISESTKSGNESELAQDQEIEASKNIHKQSRNEDGVVKGLHEDSTADNKSLGEEEEEREYTDEAPMELNPQEDFDKLDSGYTKTEVKCSTEENVSTVDLNEEEDGDILCNTTKDLQSTLPVVEETKQEEVCEENQVPAKETKHVHEIGTKLNSTEKLQINAEDNTNDKLQQHGEASQEQDHETPKEIENTIHGSETTFDASSVTNSEEACLHKEVSSTPELTFESLEGMQDGSRIEPKEKEDQAEETSEVQLQQSPHEIQFSDSQSVENDQSVETGAEKTFTDDHSSSSESSKKDADVYEASLVESEKSEKVLESVTQVHYSEVPYEIESGIKEKSLEAATIELRVEKILNEETNEAKGTTENYISREKIREEDSHFDPTKKEIIPEELPSIITHVISETTKSGNKSEVARDQEIEARKNIHKQSTNEDGVVKGLHEDSTADNKSLGEEEKERQYTDETTMELFPQEDFDKLDSGHTKTEVKCSTEEVLSSEIVFLQHEKDREVDDQEYPIEKKSQAQNAEINDFLVVDIPGVKGVTENIVSEAEHEGVLHESTKDSEINKKSSTAVEINKEVSIAADNNTLPSLMDHEKPDIGPVEIACEENKASRGFSPKEKKDNEDKPGALSPRGAFEENSNIQKEEEHEEKHSVTGTQPTEDSCTVNDAGSNKDEEAKEKNEDQAIVETRGSETKLGEADSQSSKTEGEDQKVHYPDVKLESLSPPEQSSTDICHIDEPLDLAKPTDIAPDTIEQNKASLAAKEIEILEKSQPSESTEVIIPSAGKDDQLLQKDPAVTTVQDEIQKLESENDANAASEAAKVESEGKGTSNEPKEMEQESTSIKPAKNSESDLMQGSSNKTLYVVEERETSDQLAEDHISEHVKNSNIRTVQKEDQVDLSSNKDIRAKMKDINSYAVSGNMIPVQNDPEEIAEPVISSGDKDLLLAQPVSITGTVRREIEELKHANASEAVAEEERAECGDGTRTRECGEGGGIIHDYIQIAESSQSVESTISAPSDFWQGSAKETTQEAQDIDSQSLAAPLLPSHTHIELEADPRVTVDPNSFIGDKNAPQMQEEVAAENFQVGEIPRCAEPSHKEAKSQEDQRISDEIKEPMGKFLSTETANTSASEEETLKIADHISERSKAKKKEVKTENAERAEDKEVKTDGAKDEEEEEEVQRGESSGSEEKDQVDGTSNKIIAAVEMKEDSSSALPDKAVQGDPEDSIETVISSEDKDIQSVSVTGNVELEIDELKHVDASEAASNKDEEAKEKDEDQATVATRASETKLDEADSQSSQSMGSTECPPSNLLQGSLEETVQEAEDIDPQPLVAPPLPSHKHIELEADLRVNVNPKNSMGDENVPQMQEEAAAEIFQVGGVIPRCAEQSAEETKSEEEQRITDEIKEAAGKFLPTETATSASEEETLEIAEHLSERSKLIAKMEELQTENAERAEDKEVKTGEAKDEEVEGEIQRGENSGSEVSLIVEKDPVDLTSNKIISADLKEDSSSVLPNKKILVQGDPEEGIETVISSDDKDIQPVSVTDTSGHVIDELEHVDSSEAAGSSKNEEEKENDEDQTIIATRGIETKQDEADSQSSIIEGEGQKIHVPDVKLESLSPPEQPSTDICHIDEPLDLHKVSVATKEMGISEEPSSSESTEVTITSADKDIELLQKDPAVTVVQDEIQKLKTENDPNAASEAAMVESEAKGATDESKEMEQESTSIKTAKNLESDLMQGYTDQTLSVAEESKTLDQLAEDHVYDHVKNSNMGIVQKEDQVDLSSNKSTGGEINDNSSFTVPGNNIPVQKDPEESSKPVVSSGEKDVPRLQPHSVTVEREIEEIEHVNTSEAIVEAERVECGNNSRTGECGEEKGTIDDYNQIPESSKSMESSAPTDLRQGFAKETIQEAEDIDSQDQHEDLNAVQQIQDSPIRTVQEGGLNVIGITQKTEELEAAPSLPSHKHRELEADPRITVDPKIFTGDKNVPQIQEAAAAENFQAGGEIPRCDEPSPEEAKCEEEQRITDEIEEATGNSLPTVIANTAAPKEETLEIAENAERAEDKEVKTDEAKDEEEEGEVQRGENSGFEVPLMVEKDPVDLTSNKIITVEMKEDSSSAVPEKKIPVQGEPEESMETLISSEDKDIPPVSLTGAVKLEELKHVNVSEAAVEEDSAECVEEKRATHDYKEIPESSRSMVSTKSSPSDPWQASAKETTMKVEGIESQDPESLHIPTHAKGSFVEMNAKDGARYNDITRDKQEPVAVPPLASEERIVLEADPRATPEPENSENVTQVQQEAAVENQAGGENSTCAEPSHGPGESKEEQRISDERKQAMVKSPPTETANSITAVSEKESTEVAEHFNEGNELVTKKEELHTEKAERAEDEAVKTDEEEEGDEQKGENSGSEAPVIVEASRDVDAKVSPKKSHNILSGVGSKVKHSIAKVKKAITGKHSNPKPTSPK